MISSIVIVSTVTILFSLGSQTSLNSVAEQFGPIGMTMQV